MEKEADKEPPEVDEGSVGERASSNGTKVKASGSVDASCSEESGPYSEALSPRDAGESSGVEQNSPPPSHDSTGSVSSEADPIDWVQRQISVGVNPKELLLALVGPDFPLPPDADDILLWRLVIELLTQSSPRQRLAKFSSLEDVIHLIHTSSNIVVLAGAGISVSCGIPDFRSPTGIYARLSHEFPELPDPQAMFDIHYFRDDPRPFFRFAKAIYPGQFSPSASHRFIAALEAHGKLLRLYTQNIDTLEEAAGITRAVYCHGSFSTATCCNCGLKVDADSIRQEIFNQQVPLCPRCAGRSEEGVVKPDIVFFGEGLPDSFHQEFQRDKDKADLLIIMGSSLKVRPVSLIPSLLPPSVPQVLINLERLHHVCFDIELLGYSDEIVGELCRRLGEGWSDGRTSPGPSSENAMGRGGQRSHQSHRYMLAPAAGIRHRGHVHVFPGATVSEGDLESSEGGEEEGVASDEGSQPKRMKLDQNVLS